MDMDMDMDNSHPHAVGHGLDVRRRGSRSSDLRALTGPVTRAARRTRRGPVGLGAPAGGRAFRFPHSGRVHTTNGRTV